MNIKIDLDDLWSGDDFGSTVGEILREELRSIIKSELRKKLKNSDELKGVIDAYVVRAVQEAMILNKGTT